VQQCQWCRCVEKFRHVWINELNMPTVLVDLITPLLLPEVRMDSSRGCFCERVIVSSTGHATSAWTDSQVFEPCGNTLCALYEWLSTIDQALPVPDPLLI